jgi:hypothetical protein
MKLVKGTLLAALALLVVSVAVTAQNKPSDAFGRIDKAEVVVKHVKADVFSLDLRWNNDQQLAAFTYPLIVRGKGFHMRYDSVSWSPRTSYFAVKSVMPIDSLQQVLIGFFADLDGTKEPLAIAEGSVATLYFTGEGSSKSGSDPCGVIIDTTFIRPANTLSGVTPDGAGLIQPVFEVSRLSADGKAVSCKQLH